MTPACAQCRFWRQVKDFHVEPYGYCARRSPVAVALWPATARTDWCGEFEGKGEPKRPWAYPDVIKCDVMPETPARPFVAPFLPPDAKASNSECIGLGGTPKEPTPSVPLSELIRKYAADCTEAEKAQLNELARGIAERHGYKLPEP